VRKLYNYIIFLLINVITVFGRKSSVIIIAYINYKKAVPLHATKALEGEK
jgi:hypothetical protein